MFILPVCKRRDTSTGGRNIQILLERSTGSAVEGHCRFHTTSGVIRTGNCAHDTMDVIGGCILLHHICQLQTLTYVLHTFRHQTQALGEMGCPRNASFRVRLQDIPHANTIYRVRFRDIHHCNTNYRTRLRDIHNTNVHYRVYTSGIYLPL